MRLYHGSISIINKPTYGIGKKHNDYGLGFYCTENKDLAYEWGANDSGIGYCNEYNFNTDNLKILDLTEYNMLSWLAILLVNRKFEINNPLAKEANDYILDNFLIDTSDYDVIIGYRADDSYFLFANDFLNNSISFEKLCYAMKLGELGIQVVLKSKMAFDSIEFINYERIDCDKWLNRKKFRDENARENYFKNRKEKTNLKEIFILDILREEMKKDDPRICRK